MWVLGLRLRRKLRLDSREIESEGRALSDLALDGDEAVTLFGDAVDSGEAESSPFARFLRCEKRFEQLFLCRVVHPQPVSRTSKDT